MDKLFVEYLRNITNDNSICGIQVINDVINLMFDTEEDRLLFYLKHTKTNFNQEYMIWSTMSNQSRVY